MMNISKITLHYLLMVLLLAYSASASTNPNNHTIPIKEEFWDKQQKGANIFNRIISLEDIKAAKAYGIKFIRLAPDKFISTSRDFLIGDADNYRGLVKEDVIKLKQVLEWCLQEDMPVVITMLSLPGSRWKQNNNDRDDLRIWQEDKFQQQATQFWQDLALELKDHLAIVGYNILNEPHPEKLYAEESNQLNKTQQEEVQKKLHAFYEKVIGGIRSVDLYTPIMLDNSGYANASTFDKLRPSSDQNVIYSFHMYEPYEYTNYRSNQGKFRYPGKIAGHSWSKNALESYMLPVVHFQKSYNIPATKILVGEFGGHRTSLGLEQYFDDLLSIFVKNGWHFAFYAFREDTWDGMDYELGNKRLPQDYWDEVNNNRSSYLERSSNHPAFAVIKKVLK